MKKLVLAEKPSVARQLADALRCTRRMDGYIEGEEYLVTWALGHLVELANPDHYNPRWRRWSAASLPMLPTPLEQVPIERTGEQFAIVKGLLNRSDVASVVIATDAGREGELVARWILALSGYQGAIERLWISSQTATSIAEGFANLRDGASYERLFRAAESRAAADWYVGMNVTRAMTCTYDARLSAGRVQTPTLALMVEREDEIEAFEGAFYWTLRADFTHFWASYYPEEHSIRIQDEDLATELERSLLASRATVTSIERVERSEAVPLAYDLTELQRDANLLLDFSAKETLDILQRLYERHRIVTYPRTDSRYITSDIVPTLPSRLSALRNTAFAPVVERFLTDGYHVDTERFVQDAQVGDHHAIIPTEERVDLNRLSAEERALWELIALRFLEVLSEAYRYETTTIGLGVDEHRFKTRTTLPLEQGWRSVATHIGKRSTAALVDEEEGPPFLLTLKEGDELLIAQTTLKRMSTPAPARYSEATLLSAMEHAGRFVDDLSIKRQLSGGIGTPATRADIIEKLIQNHYIERDGKELVPTPRGRELIRLVPEELKSVELTGRWEQRLTDIAEGNETADAFIADIMQSTRRLVDEVLNSREQYEPNFVDSKRCPHCASTMMKVVDALAQNHYICQRLSCSYEEKEIKKRVFDPPAPAAASKPGAVESKKRVVVKRASPAGGSSGAKKRVVVAKTQPAERSWRWETSIEVVRPSKLDRTRPRGDDRRGDGGWKSPKTREHLFDEAPTGGGSIADFMRVQKQRDRKRKRE